MKKADVVEGETYYANPSTTSEYRSYVVRVLENEEYYEADNGYSADVPRDYYYRDPDYVDAHYRKSVAAQYPRDFSENEQRARERAFRQQVEVTRRRYFDEDPMRRFRKGKRKYSSGGGILCRSIKRDKDGGGHIDGGLVLVPRRELRMTWKAFVKQQEDLKVARAEAAARAVEHKRERAVTRAALDEVMAKLGYTSEYGTSYKLEVDGKLEEFLSSSGRGLNLSNEQLLKLVTSAIQYGREDEAASYSLAEVRNGTGWAPGVSFKVVTD